MSDSPSARPAIRPLVADDLDAIAEIHWAAAQRAFAYRGWDHSLAEVQAWYAGKMPDWDWGRIATARGSEGAGRPIGFIAATGAFLDQLFVLPELQRTGVGGRLLDAMLARGPDSVMLHVLEGNGPARAFYERHGFVVERTWWDSDEDETVVLYRRGSI